MVSPMTWYMAHQPSIAKMRIIWLQMESTLEQLFPRARLKTVPSRSILMQTRNNDFLVEN